MRILKRIAIFILILSCISGVDVRAQVVVERSETKAVISGVTYYVHIVKKGETAYSVSRAYGIRVDDLVKENPAAVYGVNEGQSLRIPVDLVQQADEAQAQPVTVKPKDEARYIYHVVKRGDTVYSLSRQYNVTENDITKSNPEVDITKISIGTEIAIPRSQPAANNQQSVTTGNQFFLHKAQKGESLSSIARLYNIPLRELRNANPNIRFLQVDDNVRIPGRSPYIQEEIAKKEETPTPAVSEEPIEIGRPAAPANFTKLSGKVDVAVLLPFYLNENTIDTSRTANRERRPNDWIYPGSLDFIEMYEGILLAADTLRSLGLDVNIHAYDIQNNTSDLSRLIQSGSLRNMDMIIGPVYPNNLKTVTEYARNFDIPVISPVPLFTNSHLEGNPNLFMASPTLEVAQSALAKKIAEYRNHNFIFVHADSMRVDEDVQKFKNMIMRELSTSSPSEEVRFREKLFLSRSMLGNDRLDNMLSNQTGNVVIIASEQAPVISETITDVQGLSKRFDVKVFGYPLLRELETLDPRYFFDLDMLLYSTSWIDYTKPNVRQFNADYRTTFFTQPSEISFAWQGYDIAYYFMSGLALYGKDFIKNPSMHRPELLHTDFNFVRKSARDGFENQKLFLIRYTKDFNVVLADDKTR